MVNADSVNALHFIFYNKFVEKMTRQVEPLNHEMGQRLNSPVDAVPVQRDIGFIVRYKIFDNKFPKLFCFSLFKYKNVSLKAIGDQFIQVRQVKFPF